jgi:hypothetical protein
MPFCRRKSSPPSPAFSGRNSRPRRNRSSARKDEVKDNSQSNLHCKTETTRGVSRVSEWLIAALNQVADSTLSEAPLVAKAGDERPPIVHFRSCWQSSAKAGPSTRHPHPPLLNNIANKRLSKLSPYVESTTYKISAAFPAKIFIPLHLYAKYSCVRTYWHASRSPDYRL